MASTVFLVRHAAHDRLGRILCGRMPGVGLGATGRLQAAALATFFAGRKVSMVLSSPLQRAQETAGPIASALGLPVVTSEGLNEIDFGEWTGLGFEALASDPRFAVWNGERAGACPPGGEPMRAVQDRALLAIRRLGETVGDGTAVTVSHGDVIKAVICGLLGLSLDRHDSFDIEPASVSAIVLWPGGGKVAALNDLAPASGQAGESAFPRAAAA